MQTRVTSAKSLEVGFGLEIESRYLKLQMLQMQMCFQSSAPLGVIELLDTHSSDTHSIRIAVIYKVVMRIVHIVVIRVAWVLHSSRVA